jgi:hypothetical protein
VVDLDPFWRFEHFGERDGHDVRRLQGNNVVPLFIADGPYRSAAKSHRE